MFFGPAVAQSFTARQARQHPQPTKHAKAGNIFKLISEVLPKRQCLQSVHVWATTTASMLQTIHSISPHHLPATTPPWRSSRSGRQHLSSRRCRATCAGQDVQCGIRDGSSLSGPLESSDPVLYTHTCCPYAERCLLAILEKVGGC